MKYEVEFDVIPGCVRITTFGIASVEGFRTLTDAVVTDPRWHAGILAIVDHRQLLQENLTAEDMRAIEELTVTHQGVLGLSRVAFVTRDDYGVETARRFGEHMVANGTMKAIAVFRTMDEAVSWVRSQSEAGE